jgi:Xaa-Pro aminopeptidase
MLLYLGSNMEYLSGFEAERLGRHMFLAVPSEGEPEFFAPEIFREEVNDTGLKFTIWKSSEDVVDRLESFLSKFDSESVLLDDNMWEFFSRDVRRILDSEFGLASWVMDDIRAVKSQYEIAQIKEASEIADRAVQDVRDKDAIGMTEKELRDFIEDRMKEYGGENPSFETVVASGPNGAKPHHKCSDRKIQSGEPVVLDFGCWVNGYPSDQTRTMVFGEEPSKEFKEAFEIVKNAQEKGVQAIEPGVQDSHIDDVVRDVIEGAGYGDEFIHRTGHGVGVEIHECPKIPPKNHETAMKLKPGMVFSVEPGIYKEGEFGIRIEDLVLVTEDGCERLNKSERDYHS